MIYEIVMVISLDNFWYYSSCSLAFPDRFFRFPTSNRLHPRVPSGGVFSIWQHALPSFFLLFPDRSWGDSENKKRNVVRENHTHRRSSTFFFLAFLDHFWSLKHWEAIWKIKDHVNVVRENWTQGLCAGRSRRQALCGSAIPNLG